MLIYLWSFDEKLEDAEIKERRHMIARMVYYISFVLFVVEILLLNFGYTSSKGIFTRLCLILMKPILIVNGG